MTLFIWDQSHYDGHITTAIMARARAAGIIGVTHKIGEGTGGDDPEDRTALAAARDAGIEFIGGYHVVRTGDIGAQVDALLALADRDEPWWREFPGWFWQTDLERWPWDNVSAATGVAFARLLRQRAGRMVALYASHGQYDNQLSGWDGPLWNADYVQRTAAGFRVMYPGDAWMPLHGSWRGGWAPYSGKPPTFLQYSSSATIGGLTTCDANAYRGTVEQLRALIHSTTGDDMPLTDADAKLVAGKVLGTLLGSSGPTVAVALQSGYSQIQALAAEAAADKTRDAATLAAIQALAAGGGADVAPVLAAIEAAAAASRDQVTALQAEIDELRAQLAAAARGAADALDGR